MQEEAWSQAFADELISRKNSDGYELALRYLCAVFSATLPPPAMLPGMRQYGCNVQSQITDMGLLGSHESLYVERLLSARAAVVTNGSQQHTLCQSSAIDQRFLPLELEALDERMQCGC